MKQREPLVERGGGSQLMRTSRGGGRGGGRTSVLRVW